MLIVKTYTIYQFSVLSLKPTKILSGETNEYSVSYFRVCGVVGA